MLLFGSGGGRLSLNRTRSTQQLSSVTCYFGCVVQDADEINAWADIYNEAYDAQTAANEDPTLNFSGYDNSYTPHVPHEPPVVREWVETTCERIAEFKAKRAMEMGTSGWLRVRCSTPWSDNGLRHHHLHPSGLHAALVVL